MRGGIECFFFAYSRILLAVNSATAKTRKEIHLENIKFSSLFCSSDCNTQAQFERAYF